MSDNSWVAETRLIFQKLELPSITGEQLEKLMQKLDPTWTTERTATLLKFMGVSLPDDISIDKIIDWCCAMDTPAWPLNATSSRIGLTAMAGRDAPQLAFIAVGGAPEHRSQRKLLLDACCPEISSRSFALAGSMYNRRRPFPIPSWIPSVLKISDKESTEPVLRPPFAMESEDIVLVIGHIHDEEFKELLARHPKQLPENIWVQGGSSSAFNLKMSIGNCITQEACPKYTISDWMPILDAYPDVLQRMRSFQWGGFFVSRLASLIREDSSGLVTDAFCRQFNLQGIVKDGRTVEFEKDVLTNASECEQTQRVLSQIASTCPEGMDTKTALENIFEAYRDCGPWEDENTVKSITQSLLKVIPRYTPFEIKEYDSFVAHRMLRHYAGIMEDLTPERHLEFIQTCLKYIQGEDIADMSYEASLGEGLAGRKVMVLHDLGLDPMSDDWLAMSVLLTVVGAACEALSSS